MKNYEFGQSFDDLQQATDWKKVDGMLPVIVQDQSSGQVLMQAFMDQAALRATFELGHVTFFSRSKQRLWTKGEQSGNVLGFKGAQLDCDKDSLLVLAKPHGPTCHTGTDSCFTGNAADDFSLKSRSSSLAFLGELEALVKQRHQDMPEGSYTTHLFNKGLRKMAQKVGEEGVEIAIAAVDEDDPAFLGEAADLIFHLLVLLEARDKSLGDVLDVLKERHQEKS